MSLRTLLTPFALVAAFLAAPQVLQAQSAAQAVDPNPSLIVNKSSESYKVRISDNFVPVGIVKFYDAADKSMGSPLKTISSADEFYLLEGKKSVKMVICGSPKLQGKVIAINVSLDLMKGSSVSKKNASKLHFVHGQNGVNIVDLQKVAEMFKIPVNAVKDYYKFDIITQEATSSLVTTDSGMYQKADVGALWTIE